MFIFVYLFLLKVASAVDAKQRKAIKKPQHFLNIHKDDIISNFISLECTSHKNNLRPRLYM